LHFLTENLHFLTENLHFGMEKLYADDVVLGRILELPLFTTVIHLFNTMRIASCVAYRHKVNGIVLINMIESSASLVVGIPELQQEWWQTLQHICSKDGIGGTRNLEFASFNSQMIKAQSLVAPQDIFEDIKRRFNMSSSFLKFAVKQFCADTSARTPNWTKNCDKTFEDLLAFFNDGLGILGDNGNQLFRPQVMDCLVECLDVLQRTYGMRLECVGQLLPFLLAYMNAKESGAINPMLLGIYVHISAQGRSYRVLTYTDVLTARINCYALDMLRGNNFVFVGQLVVNHRVPRIAYMNPAQDSMPPGTIAINWNGPITAFHGALLSYLQPAMPFSPTAAMVTIDIHSDDTDSPVSTLSLFADHQDNDDVAEFALLLDAGADADTDHIVDSLPDVVTTLCLAVKELCVLQPTDNAERCGESVVQAITEVFKDISDQFHQLTAIKLQEDNNCSENIAFCDLLTAYAQSATTDTPLPKPVGDPDIISAELRTIADDIDKTFVTQLQLRACQTILASAVNKPSTARLLQACQDSISKFARGADRSVEDVAETEHRIRVIWMECIAQRSQCMQTVRDAYDESVTAVADNRECLLLLSRQMTLPRNLDNEMLVMTDA